LAIQGIIGSSTIPRHLQKANGNITAQQLTMLLVHWGNSQQTYPNG